MKFIRSLAAVAIIAFLTAMGTAPISFAQSETAAPKAVEGSEKKVDFAKLKSPVANTKKSIRRGSIVFRNQCASCHGPDGKALIDVIADATDLTSPKMYLSGTKEGEIFRSIRDGAGVSMPPYEKQIRRKEDMWHLVNFIRSLWPKNIRPEVKDEKAIEQAGSSEGTSAEDGGDTHE